MSKTVNDKAELNIGTQTRQPARLRQAKYTMMTEMECAAALGSLLWQAHSMTLPDTLLVAINLLSTRRVVNYIARIAPNNQGWMHGRSAVYERPYKPVATAISRCIALGRTVVCAIRLLHPRATEKPGHAVSYFRDRWGQIASLSIYDIEMPAIVTLFEPLLMNWFLFAVVDGSV